MTYSSILTTVLAQSRDRKQKDFLLSFGYFMHRRIAVYITAALIRFLPWVKPNYVSVLMILSLFVGGGLLFSTDTTVVLFGFVVIYISFLLDKVDGDLARYSTLFSPRGVLLDELYHLVAPIVVIMPLVSMYWSDIPLVFFVFLLAVIFSRLVRKLVAIIYVKMHTTLKARSMTWYTPAQLVLWPLNTIIFRLFSFVERFDVLLGVFLCAFLVEVFSEVSAVFPVFLVYTCAYVIYALRWMLLLYFGELEQRIQMLVNKR